MIVTLTSHRAHPLRWKTAWDDAFQAERQAYEMLESAIRAGVEPDKIARLKDRAVNLVRETNRCATRCGRTIPDREVA